MIHNQKGDFETGFVTCLPCAGFLLGLQRSLKAPFLGDCFDENRSGLDPIGFSVEPRPGLQRRLGMLAE